ncbi:MSF1 domain-containing protein [Ascosphaera apis ARSEF 7405]|uniref:MSF1 domain-containing protein n=1 Tax=Ascosphaera apis ARSEF 7405 TaxID=392613 RepID=A0A162IPQ4_9EURO|nr:MSF1 domain-containing protein [Ascosphaera apis ARSEF 7405]
MKVFSSNCTFDYSWDEVSTANWRKYCPWNDKSTHVVAVDILSRDVDPASGILRTERLITCKQTAPKWVASLFGGGDVSHVYEVSYVDPASKKVTMSSQNLTWANVLRVQETVTYSPSPQMPSSKTLFNQEAQITALAGGWQKIKNRVEELSVDVFSQNAKKGKEGFEAVLEMSRRVFGEQRESEAQKRQQTGMQPHIQ